MCPNENHLKLLRKVKYLNKPQSPDTDYFFPFIGISQM